MRRALAPLALLAAVACSRDLDLPTAGPPRIDTIEVVLPEPQAVATGLPVLGGELVAIRGGGFPADLAQLDVQIGGAAAEVLEVAQDRIIARVPSLATLGPIDLQVRTSTGFRTQTGAFRYDGAGQPSGSVTSDLPTNVAIGFVAPVQPPGPAGFNDLAIAIGASDSALLVVPAVGVAATTIPLGLVPTSAAAWFDQAAGRIEVLALGRGGEVSLGTAFLDSAGSTVNRVPAQPLSASVLPNVCTSPQVLFTHGGTPVAAWTSGLVPHQRIAAIDMAAVRSGAQYGPKGPTFTLPAPISGWDPSPADTKSVVFASGAEIYVFDAVGTTTPTPLTVLVGGVGPPQSVSSLIAAACPSAGAIEFLWTLATGATPNGQALAVGYRAGGVDRVALVDLMPGPTAGRVRTGVAGTLPTSLALVPDPPFASPTSWAVLVAGLADLYRFRPLSGAPLCGDLVPDAALQLSSVSGAVPTFGGMITTASGTRLLATTPDRDLITVLPPSLTSPGPVLRLASYGALSVQQATIGSTTIPVAVAEHEAHSSLDTGSALLVLSLAGDGGSVGLGGSGYGRGAVWLDAPIGSGLAYTGDLPKTQAASLKRGGAAAVTGFAPGVCEGEDVRIKESVPMAHGPDLVAQGPARSGALGPAGVARFGPTVPPVYAVTGSQLAVYVPDSDTVLACLAGANLGATPDWDPSQTGTCAPNATIALGVEPLDVTFSAGDHTAALRTLNSACTGGCAGDVLCLRAVCPAAKQLILVGADPLPASSVVVSLPTPPASVAADRGGGFLVTLPCDPDAASGAACFAATTLCDQFLTGPGGSDGALLRVAEDGSRMDCLAVLPALAGPLAVTPNGVEVWVTGMTATAQHLSRLVLPRRTSDGAIDATRPASRVAFEPLGLPAAGGGAFPPGGLSFTPDGSTGIVTVPGQFQILLLQ